MQSLYAFIVEPIKSRYNNTKKIGENNLILNTEIQDHRYVNRNAVVISIPKNVKTNIKIGDEIIVHHNIFRRYSNIRGEEVDSSSYFKENKYFIYLDQIFMYKQKNKWKSIDDFCFVKPIENDNIFSTEKEMELIGVVKYVENNKLIKKNTLVGFTPNSEYEFIIDNERLYRVPIKSICIKYERQGHEKEYNPSWT
jgi:hypothetical protein|tara:strand:- start:373 stop:960 length:588 start_codon:yes stop_codon:yes gene_type:complete